MDKRVPLMLSALLSGMLFFLIGPSLMVSFKESLVLMGIGQSLVGLASGFMHAPSFSEMVLAAGQVYPNQKDDPELERLALTI